ncbi:spore gernimation protein [Anaerosporomusa subterranea]|jgi:spore protease|uniref:Spore gernimation protein n=2 Tax=Anaerosporomusa subterranea TaxID=1794912 RepID=A0A154BUD3_ANASB|nr:spore gernimation protein [Anaerosporomusa subterranea]
MLSRQTREDIPGVKVETIDDDDIVITRVHITTPEAEQIMGKRQGRYVTIEAPGLRYKNTPLQEDVMQHLAEEFAELTGLAQNATILIVGLGNWNVTPDALGPKVVDKVVVTRHLQSMISPELKGGVRSVCAISPGVLGITGMETSDIIAGITARIKPDLVVAIDALAAASTQRVVTTIQLSNTGINPGSGVGNKRFGLNQESLGVPVVAIGIPTVVHASTIAMDTIDTLHQHAAFARYFKSMENLTDSDRQTIIRQVLPDTLGDLMVTPKEVDRLIDDMSIVVAGGINQALHPNIDYENIHMYIH